MIRTAYKFTFCPDVSMSEVQHALAISTIAVESIHGEAAMMVDGKFTVDRRARVCLIDAEAQISEDLARVFAGFMNARRGVCFRSETIEFRGELGDKQDLFEGLL